MKIRVKVKARAKENRAEKTAEGQYKVWVKAAAERGKANEAVVEMLSECLDVPKSRITIVSGHTSAQKTIEVR